MPPDNTDDGLRAAVALRDEHPTLPVLVRKLLIDVLTPRQLKAVADGLREVNRRMQEGGAC
ncbi:hypothetical protein [Streptomyces tailanensis]|uniref:hypothetical protein n=1 Tax=Streptomyces tailanensis TaxID=2569858 RepID=UPI001FEC8389|nr:hypothetical protein [Streptomyces tailanensis]